MFQDLRGFLEVLEREEQLLRVHREVDTRFEIAAGIRKSSDTGGPALLFDNVKGHPGWRVLGALFATRRLVAMGLGVTEDKLLERYLTLEDQRIPSEVTATGPVKEVRWTGGDVDLDRLPIAVHSEKDCGAYVTIGRRRNRRPSRDRTHWRQHRPTHG